MRTLKNGGFCLVVEIGPTAIGLYSGAAKVERSRQKTIHIDFWGIPRFN